AKTILAEVGLVVALLFGFIVANLNLTRSEKLVAMVTGGFAAGLGWRLVLPSRSHGRRGKSLAAIEWEQLQKELNRKPEKPVRLPDTFDVDQLKEACQREHFIELDLQRRVHWRTKGLRKDDSSVSNLLIARRKLSAAIAAREEMKVLIAICVFLGVSFGGGMCLLGVPIPWWLLMPLATIFSLLGFGAMHVYDVLSQPQPQDVVLDFEDGLVMWKSSEGSHSRSLSDIGRFSVSLNGIPTSRNGAALVAHFSDGVDPAILEIPRDIKPDEALAKLIPFARVVAESVGVTEEHSQFGRDHVADSYVEPWIPQPILHPKYVVAIIVVISAYYVVLFSSLP
ncbi:MAG: hypothetical protein AB8G99_22205, partial [Planctomycetaceae bacterium]